MSILIVVLLPAPLGPRNPKNRPRATRSDTPSTALFWRKTLVRFSRTSASPSGVVLSSGGEGKGIAARITRLCAREIEAIRPELAVVNVR